MGEGGELYAELGIDMENKRAVRDGQNDGIRGQGIHVRVVRVEMQYVSIIHLLRSLHLCYQQCSLSQTPKLPRLYTSRTAPKPPPRHPHTRSYPPDHQPPTPPHPTSPSTHLSPTHHPSLHQPARNILSPSPHTTIHPSPVSRLPYPQQVTSHLPHHLHSTSNHPHDTANTNLSLFIGVILQLSRRYISTTLSYTKRVFIRAVPTSCLRSRWGLPVVFWDEGGVMILVVIAEAG